MAEPWEFWDSVDSRVYESSDSDESQSDLKEKSQTRGRSNDGSKTNPGRTITSPINSSQSIVRKDYSTKTESNPKKGKKNNNEITGKVNGSGIFLSSKELISAPRINSTNPQTNNLLNAKSVHSPSSSKVEAVNPKLNRGRLSILSSLETSDIGYVIQIQHPPTKDEEANSFPKRLNSTDTSTELIMPSLSDAWDPEICLTSPALITSRLIPSEPAAALTPQRCDNENKTTIRQSPSKYTPPRYANRLLRSQVGRQSPSSKSDKVEESPKSGGSISVTSTVTSQFPTRQTRANKQLVTMLEISPNRKSNNTTIRPNNIANMMTSSLSMKQMSSPPPPHISSGDCEGVAWNYCLHPDVEVGVESEPASPSVHEKVIKTPSRQATTTTAIATSVPSIVDNWFGPVYDYSVHVSALSRPPPPPPSQSHLSLGFSPLRPSSKHILDDTMTTTPSTSTSITATPPRYVKCSAALVDEWSCSGHAVDEYSFKDLPVIMSRTPSSSSKEYVGSPSRLQLSPHHQITPKCGGRLHSGDDDGEEDGNNEKNENSTKENIDNIASELNGQDTVTAIKKDTVDFHTPPMSSCNVTTTTTTTSSNSIINRLDEGLEKIEGSTPTNSVITIASTTSTIATATITTTKKTNDSSSCNNISNDLISYSSSNINDNNNDEDNESNNNNNNTNRSTDINKNSSNSNDNINDNNINNGDDNKIFQTPEKVSRSYRASIRDCSMHNHNLSPEGVHISIQRSLWKTTPPRTSTSSSTSSSSTPSSPMHSDNDTDNTSLHILNGIESSTRVVYVDKAKYSIKSSSSTSSSTASTSAMSSGIMSNVSSKSSSSSHTPERSVTAVHDSPSQTHTSNPNYTSISNHIPNTDTVCPSSLCTPPAATASSTTTSNISGNANANELVEMNSFNALASILTALRQFHIDSDSDIKTMNRYSPKQKSDLDSALTLCQSLSQSQTPDMSVMADLLITTSALVSRLNDSRMSPLLSSLRAIRMDIANKCLSPNRDCNNNISPSIIKNKNTTVTSTSTSSSTDISDIGNDNNASPISVVDAPDIKDHHHHHVTSCAVVIPTKHTGITSCGKDSNEWFTMRDDNDSNEEEADGDEVETGFTIVTRNSSLTSV